MSRPKRADNLDAVQRAHIESVLERCGWRINGTGNTAERLGIHPNTLRFRMKKLGVMCPDGRGRRQQSSPPTPERDRVTASPRAREPLQRPPGGHSARHQSRRGFSGRVGQPAGTRRADPTGQRSIALGLALSEAATPALAP